MSHNLALPPTKSTILVFLTGLLLLPVSSGSCADNSRDVMSRIWIHELVFSCVARNSSRRCLLLLCIALLPSLLVYSVYQSVNHGGVPRRYCKCYSQGWWLGGGGGNGVGGGGFI